MVNRHIKMFLAKVARNKVTISNTPMFSECRLVLGTSIHINSEIPPSESVRLKAEIGMTGCNMVITLLPDHIWSIFCPDLVPNPIMSSKIVDSPPKISKVQPEIFHLVFSIEEVCYVDHVTNLPRCFRMEDVDLELLNQKTTLLTLGDTERLITPQDQVSSLPAQPIRRFPVPPPTFAPIQRSPSSSWSSSLNFHPISSPINLQTSSFRPRSSFNQSNRSSFHRSHAGNGATGATNINPIDDLLRRRNNQRVIEGRRRYQRRGAGETPVYESISPLHRSEDMEIEPSRDTQILHQAQQSENAIQQRAEKAARLIHQIETFLEENGNQTLESPRLMEMLRELREGSRDQVETTQHVNQDAGEDVQHEAAGDHNERLQVNGPAQNTRSQAKASTNENEN